MPPAYNEFVDLDRVFALIRQRDLQALVQKRELPQALRQECRS